MNDSFPTASNEANSCVSQQVTELLSGNYQLSVEKTCTGNSVVRKYILWINTIAMSRTISFAKSICYEISRILAITYLVQVNQQIGWNSGIIKHSCSTKVINATLAYSINSRF